MKIAVVILGLSLLQCSCEDYSTNSRPATQGITANQMKRSIIAYVNSHHAGLRLLSVSTKSIAIDGKASNWSYCYVDTAPGEHLTYYFHANLSEVAFDSTAPLLTGPSVITLRWFDSDSAMVFAELYGGSAYRIENPGTTINASLGQALTPTSVTSWRITYQGGPIPLGLIIDAGSGTLLGQTR